MQRELSKKITKRFKVTKFFNNTIIEDKLSIIKEKNYKVFVNGNKLTSVNLLPFNEIEYIYGFLFTHSLIDSLEDVVSCRICDKSNFHIYLRNNKTYSFSNVLVLSEFMEKKYLKKEDMAPVNSNISVNPLQMLNMYKKINSSVQIFPLVEGIHKCALYKSEDKFIIFEDISIFSAIDKLVGHGLINNLNNDGIFYTTDKITDEIITKCLLAKFPIVATSAFVTTMAVDLAVKFNITLAQLVDNNTFLILEDKVKRITNVF